ncbi:MAG: VOC family protein [Mariprofundaceae bacterium]|nr:VOC family protein [Mariprofundaceae bacterium]
MQLLHVSMIISDLEKSACFYEDILGLERDMRPNLGFDGLFYKLGNNQQLHLMCVHNPYQNSEKPAHGGRDFHIALGVNSIQDTCKKMDAAKISYTLSRSGRAALFCHDPDDNVIELCEVEVS